MGEEREGVVGFLRIKDDLLLAHIEYASDDRKWTGIGGFKEAGETPESALLREVEEETYMHFEADKLQKVAELHKEYILHVFITDTFTGEIRAKDKKITDLLWYPVNDLPYPFMHPDTDQWLPLVLEGKYVKVENNTIEEVDSFSDKQ